MKAFYANLDALRVLVAHSVAAQHLWHQRINLCICLALALVILAFTGSSESISHSVGAGSSCRLLRNRPWLPPRACCFPHCNMQHHPR